MYLVLSAIYLSPRWSLAHEVSKFLHTCRPAGAVRGWCAVRTLQMYFSNKFLIALALKLTIAAFFCFIGSSLYSIIGAKGV